MLAERTNLGGRSQPARVLLVEDEPTIAVTLGDELEEHGYRVTAVAHGDAALGVVRSSAFDAVVTDLRLPGATGIDIVRAVKQQCPRSRVLVVSAYFGGQEAVVVGAGADGVLRKPFVNRDVVAWLREQLSASSSPGLARCGRYAAPPR